MKDIGRFVRRGRLIVGIYIAVQIVLASFLVYLTIVKQQDLVRTAAKVVTQGCLMYGLWTGTKWVKWFHAVSFFLAGLILCYVCFRFPLGGVLLFLGAGALLCFLLSYVFSFSRSVNEFLASQRGDYTQSEHDEILDRVKHQQPSMDWNFLEQTDDGCTQPQSDE